MAFDLKSEKFWDESALDREFRRVWDICNGCRRCYNLCPSFNTMLNRLDEPEIDGEADRLSKADFRKVVDECYYCNLCVPHCPYTPPHRWEIDFPKLMLRAKLVNARREGVARQDRFLGNTKLIGSINSLLAPVVNLLSNFKPHRIALEKIVGIHRDKRLPKNFFKTFVKWHRQEHSAPDTRNATGKVVLFYTCPVNYNAPDIGRAAVEVLEHNDIEVAVPEHECCGAPNLHSSNLEAALSSVRKNVEQLHSWVERGYSIVVPMPTCSFMLKHEYPVLSGDPRAKIVSSHTYDLCEFLMKLHAEGKLKTDFKIRGESVAYQLPCHLKVQNMGYKSRDLMALVPGTAVQVIERCSGVDGTWGFKRQYYQLSVGIAKELFREVQSSGANNVVSDCALAASHIGQGTNTEPVHPVQYIHRAYGLPR